MQRRLSIPSITASTNSVIVGILGASAAYNEIHMRQLTQTIEQLWGKPDRVLFQQSGYSTMYIDAWAEDNNIPVTIIKPEWTTYGPRACAMVNSRIEKESTHIVIIRSPRAKSDKMIQKAEQLSSKKSKECLVLVGTESDGSAIIDQYEVPAKEKKSTGPANADIRKMFLTAKLTTA
jgi:hypothetical protein